MTTRRAVIIGTNYKDTCYELGGCINDALVVNKFLTNECKVKYDQSNIRLLVDDNTLVQSYPVYKPPSKSNIIESMQWLIKGVKKGDQLIFYVSSHGEQLDCSDGTESDNKNEAIRCINNEFLLDDEIWKYMVSKVPKNVNLTCVFDCCHSGTITDLQYCFMYAPFTNNIFTMSIEKS